MSTSTLDRPNAGQTKSTDNGRRKEILDALERFEKLRSEYAAKPGDDGPGLSLYHAAAGIPLAFVAGPVPLDLMDAMLPAQEIARHLVKLIDDPDVDLTQAIPGDTLWSSYEAVRKVLDGESEPNRKEIEPIAVLLKQDVSIAQIAKIHGLSEAQVRAEKEKPGSVCGEGYVPPAVIAEEKRQRAEAVSRWPNGYELSVLTNRLIAAGFGD